MSEHYRGVPGDKSARYGANTRRVSAYRDEVMNPKAIVAVMAVALLAAGSVVYALWSGMLKNKGAIQEGSQARQDGQVAEGSGASGATTIDLVAFGDVVVNWSVYTSGMPEEGERNYNHLFENVKNEVDAADLSIISQETTLGGEEFGWSEEPDFNGPKEIADSIAFTGFDVVLKASNHALDKGAEALTAELDFWESEHPTVNVIGAVKPASGANPNPPYIYEKNGVQVAVFNYTLASDIPETPEAQEGEEQPVSLDGTLAVLAEDQIRKDIIGVRDRVDIVVVCPHWGTENYSMPDSEQTSWANFFLDLGVDVCIGTRPHVLQPVELLTNDDGNQMLCFWSLGCFIDGLYTNSNMVGGMAKVSIEKGTTGNARITGYGLYPTVCHVAAGTDETTYMLYAYTDQLAETSRFSGVTPAWAKDTCSATLGDSFDRESGRLWVEL